MPTMKKGKEILSSQVGKKLQGGLFQSFYLNGELVDEVNVLYLKFDKWLEAWTTHGTTVAYTPEKGPEAIGGWTDREGVKFDYPLSDL